MHISFLLHIPCYSYSLWRTFRDLRSDLQYTFSAYVHCRFPRIIILFTYFLRPNTMKPTSKVCIEKLYWTSEQKSFYFFSHNISQHKLTSTARQRYKLISTLALTIHRWNIHKYNKVLKKKTSLKNALLKFSFHNGNIEKKLWWTWKMEHILTSHLIFMQYI